MRLAMQPGKDHPDNELHEFLMADASFCARSCQNVPNGYYNI
jgi:hypothetical protein